MIEIQPTYDSGFANSHGIIFASINSNVPMSQPISIAPSYIPKPVDSSLESSNIENILDYNSNNSPFNLSPSFSQSPSQSPVHDEPAKPESSFSSSVFTFAPLQSIPSHPKPSRPTAVSSTSNHISTINQIVQEANHKPSSSTVPSVTQQTSISSPNNPSLKSQCGITNYTSSRVVGGTITQIGEQNNLVANDKKNRSMYYVFRFDFTRICHFIGQYPWIAALGYHLPNITRNRLHFHCAGSLVALFFSSWSFVEKFEIWKKISLIIFITDH